MGLVERRGEQNLHGSDQFGIDKGCQQYAIALLHSLNNLFEKRFSSGPRKRRHEANRSSLHAIKQHLDQGPQVLKPFGCVQLSNLDHKNERVKYMYTREDSVDARKRPMGNRIIWILIALVAATPLVHAQWLNHRTPNIPRTADGKPNLSARTPRGANGRPDLSGLWQTDSAPPELLERLIPAATNGAGEEPLSQYFINIFSDFKPEDVPFRPAAAQLFRQREQNFSNLSPISHCLPEGMPMLEMAPAPYKIVQTAGVTFMLYERDTTYRQVYTDGRKLPDDPQPSWLGYSVGKWDGDSLVVDSIGFNDRGWLDARAHTHSQALHLTERFHRLDLGHMEVQLTIDDPETYTRPFTIKLKQRLLPDTDLLESFCAENEKDASHIERK